MTDFDREIAQHESAIAELKRQKDEFLAMSPAAQLAISLHDATCSWNHTDGCGWFYEIDKGIHNWTGYSHSSFLRKAETMMKLLPGVDSETIIAVTKTIKGL